MKRTTEPNAVAPPPLSSTSSHQITSSLPCSNSSHASNALTSYNQLKLEESLQCLFGRCIASCDDLVSKILLLCQSKDVLNLRLTSMGCYQCVSIINSYFTNNLLSLLATKTTIPFSYSKIHPIIESSQQAKFEFAKNNTQIAVNISLTDLINVSHDPSSILHSIPSNRIKLTLQIKNISELHQLHASLSTSFNQCNSQFINKIIGMDLSLIEIDLNTIKLIDELLIAISDKLKLFPDLTALSLGSIDGGVSFALPNAFNFLNSFKCGNICQDAILSLPDQFNSLIFFECGNICESATLILSNQLNSLSSFKFDNIYEHAILTFPSQLNSLNSFECGIIYNNFTLPNELKSLSSFSCRYLSANLEFPISLCNLSILTINQIGNDVYLTLPQTLGPKTTLKITSIGNHLTIKLPEAFHHQIPRPEKKDNNVIFILSYTTATKES